MTWFKDDPGSESRLQAKDGCLGYFSNKGWEPKTNFVVDFKADLVSREYNMKGNIFELKFVSGEKVDIYIPEAALYNSKSFKRHFDKQCIDIKMILVGISEKSWSDLIRKSGVAFSMSSRYRKMFMVEMLGLQSHTVVRRRLLLVSSSIWCKYSGSKWHKYLEVGLWTKKLLQSRWNCWQWSDSFLVNSLN